MHARNLNARTAIEKDTLPDIAERLRDKTTLKLIMLAPTTFVTGVGRLSISIRIVQKLTTRVSGDSARY